MIFTDNYDMSLFEFSINNEQENYMIFDKLVTENEMLCSIYENEQLVIETNREIFTSLGYTSINEASIKEIANKVKKGFLFILGKIKDLITRFINFILGKKKKENNNSTEKQLPAFPETPKEAEKMAEDLEEDIEQKVKVANDISDIMEKINLKQKKDRIEIIKSEIEEIWTKEKYYEIPNFDIKDSYVAKKVNSSIDLINNNNYLNDIKDAIDEGILMLKDPSISIQFKTKRDTGLMFLPETRNKFKKFFKVYDGVNLVLDKRQGKLAYQDYLFGGLFPEFKEKMMLDESHEKITEALNNKVNFQKYSHHISENVYIEKTDKILQKSLEEFKKTLSEINDLQSKVNSLKEPLSNENVYTEGYNFIYRETSRNISMLLNAYTWTIKYLTDVDRLYSMCRQNIFNMMIDNRKLDQLSEELKNVAKELLKSGQIPKDSQYYKYLNDIDWGMGSTKKYTSAKYNYDGMSKYI